MSTNQEKIHRIINWTNERTSIIGQPLTDSQKDYLKFIINDQFPENASPQIDSVGTELIALERKKQIDKHGFTAEHHANNPEWYEEKQLIHAARLLTDPFLHLFKDDNNSKPKNWDSEWFNRLKNRPRKDRLVIAAALIAAELDRLNEIEKEG